jgi:hypothetical protein
LTDLSLSGNNHGKKKRVFYFVVQKEANEKRNSTIPNFTGYGLNTTVDIDHGLLDCCIAG